MPNIKISNLPASSGISNDDLLIIVDDPSGIPSTKKITRQDLFKPIIKLVDQPLPLTINNLDHENADILMFNLDNSPLISGYLSLTGMKAGYDGQRVTIFNISNSGYEFRVPYVNTATCGGVSHPFSLYKSILFFNEYLGSGSSIENRFRLPNFNPHFSNNTVKAEQVSCGCETTLMYSSHLQRWTFSTSNSDQRDRFIPDSPGSVGGGGV